MKLQIKNFWKTSWFWLLLITILAAILRLWQLGSVPSSPDWDEAALGYNAYSILHTGRDEYGQFLPIIFRSFDDYKPGLYIYLIVPFIKIFGLSLWVTRLPAALFGIVLVVATFFLVKELLKNEKIALIASFLLAISPWHIQFTHAAFEASVGAACNTLSVLFFLKGLKKPGLFFLSILFIVASMYVYQSDKLFAPLLFLLLIGIFWKTIFKINKKLLISLIVFGSILVLPLISYTITNKDAFARARGVSVFAESTQLLQDNSRRLLVDRQNKDYLGLITDNRRLVFAREIVANYLSHFSLNWLFITGDLERHHAPGMGLLYIWELPFVLIGLYILLFGDFDKKTKFLLTIWMLLVPIPASVTTGVPHAIRTINFLPLFQIITAIGVVTVYKKIFSMKNILLKTGISGVIIISFVFNIIYYLNQYFVQQNYYTSEFWQYGYAVAIPEIQSIEQKYKKIIVSNQPYMDQSYMFFLFYLQYSPQKYQQAAQDASGGFRETHAFGKYEFRPIQWNKEAKSDNVLYVGRAQDFPDGVKVLKEIDFLNGKPAMKIVQG